MTAAPDVLAEQPETWRVGPTTATHIHFAPEPVRTELPVLGRSSTPPPADAPAPQEQRPAAAPAVPPLRGSRAGARVSAPESTVLERVEVEQPEPPAADDVTVRLAPAEPQMLPREEPMTEPIWGGERQTRIGYVMSLSASGVGQVIFLGTAWHATDHFWIWGPVAFLACFTEVVMSGAGNNSMKWRQATKKAALRRGEKKASKGWVLLLVLALATCAYLAGSQLLHWWHQSVSMAFFFAGASSIGFLLHLIMGHLKVSAYLADERHRISVEKAEAEEAQRRALDAEIKEREREEAERQEREAAQRATEEAKARRTSATKPAATKPATKTTRGRKQATAEIATKWAAEHGNPEPWVVEEALQAAGYSTPNRRTLRRWLNEQH